MKKNIQVLIIDPQNDFCDLPVDWLSTDPVTGQVTSPALPVTGAHADMLRLAKLIREGGSGISGICVTLDSHHRFDIAHPTFWKTRAGDSVQPFTPITAAQVRNGEYAPKDTSMLPKALAYIDQLEQRGRYTLMVWPVHCEIGSWGHNVHPEVKAAYNLWEDSNSAMAQKISKGSNPWTEHYSAMQAEVPDEEDPATQLNTALIASLDQADLLIIAGEASSHCVKATTEHIVANLPSGNTRKVVLLSDCMSSVGGFEAQHKAFLDNMASLGVVLSTSAAMLSVLSANA
jgi:nicotinamidase/pyrazinamidase